MILEFIGIRDALLSGRARYVALQESYLNSSTTFTIGGYTRVRSQYRYLKQEYLIPCKMLCRNYGVEAWTPCGQLAGTRTCSWTPLRIREREEAQCHSTPGVRNSKCLKHPIDPNLTNFPWIQ